MKLSDYQIKILKQTAYSVCLITGNGSDSNQVNGKSIRFDSCMTLLIHGLIKHDLRGSKIDCPAFRLTEKGKDFLESLKTETQ